MTRAEYDDLQRMVGLAKTNLREMVHLAGCARVIERGAEQTDFERLQTALERNDELEDALRAALRRWAISENARRGVPDYIQHSPGVDGAIYRDISERLTDRPRRELTAFVHDLLANAGTEPRPNGDALPLTTFVECDLLRQWVEGLRDALWSGVGACEAAEVGDGSSLRQAAAELQAWANRLDALAPQIEDEGE